MCVFVGKTRHHVLAVLDDHLQSRYNLEFARRLTLLLHTRGRGGKKSVPNMDARTASNLACFSSRLPASCSHSGFLSASLAMRSASRTSSDSFRTSSLKSICRRGKSRGVEMLGARHTYILRCRCHFGFLNTLPVLPESTCWVQPLLVPVLCCARFCVCL